MGEHFDCVRKGNDAGNRAKVSPDVMFERKLKAEQRALLLRRGEDFELAELGGGA